jgi:hypothetical protein
LPETFGQVRLDLDQAALELVEAGSSFAFAPRDASTCLRYCCEAGYE